MQKFSLILFLFFISCSVSVKEIGKINQISNRNVDAQQQYVLLEQYAGGGKELQRGKATTIEGAIDALVKKYPGGEFLRNVRIYIVNSQYFAVEGDVWGTKIDQVQGFKVGDVVRYNNKYEGTVTHLKGDKCTIKFKDNKAMDIEYSKLLKVSSK